MSCSLTIPDDFPNSGLLTACQHAGGFLGNDIYRDLLPRLILNNKDKCSPTITSLIGTSTSCMLNGLSLFFVLVFLFPKTMAPGMNSRWIWYYLIVGTSVFIPILFGLIYYIARNTGAFNEKEDTPVWSTVAFGGSMLMYVVLVISGIIGLGYMILKNNINILLLTFMILLLMPVAKTILPIMILLLGPGCIPPLLGKSFFEFCTT